MLAVREITTTNLYRLAEFDGLIVEIHRKRSRILRIDEGLGCAFFDTQCFGKEATQ